MGWEHSENTPFTYLEAETHQESGGHLPYPGPGAGSKCGTSTGVWITERALASPNVIAVAPAFPGSATLICQTAALSDRVETGRSAAPIR